MYRRLRGTLDLSALEPINLSHHSDESQASAPVPVMVCWAYPSFSFIRRYRLAVATNVGKPATPQPSQNSLAASDSRAKSPKVGGEEQQK